MFATATDSEVEVPSLLWGLNPIFSAFARLYIKDILEMKESKQVPGIFFYNRHPIKQVDILGTVVLIKERDAFHTYGVDDGTGVIRCICWKNSLAEQKSLSDKVDDPVCEVQIARMLELPRLYRDIYDKVFQIPEETKSSRGTADLLGSANVLSENIRTFLLRNKIQSFYKQELETVEDLVAVIRQSRASTTAEQADSKSYSFSSLIRESFAEAIKMLQKKGVLFQKSKNLNDLYYVTEQDRELHRVTLEVLKDDCKRPKYAEKGCHLRHILNCIQQSYSPYITEAVVRCLLEWLETNSDVVTTMEEYYTVF
ncbi:CST complex subunit STN1 isoform X4 [Sceloporus undulatus]|uniref:CST complex subunit STN1 isoform X4 n=1 Tax=Sceloporus undulatus TaxID=8520 RepID=UPI001C4CA606|nr:CST complex subunit STN1 isoform X4 [Sceloporus undulatus]